MRMLCLLTAACCCVLEAQTATVPEMDLEINRQASATIARGWPVIVRAVVISSDGGPVGIGVNGGPWTQSLTLTILDQNGTAQKWSAQLLAADADSPMLGGIDTAQAIWVIAPADTQSLPDGTYEIRAMFDTTRSAAPGQFAGKVASRPVQLVVGAEPDLPSAGDDAMKYSALADYDVLTGQPDDAAAALDTLIARQPDNLMAQFEKAELLEQAGEFETALDMMQSVLQTTRAKEAPGDPPHTVLQQFVLRLAEELGNQQNADGGAVPQDRGRRPRRPDGDRK